MLFSAVEIVASMHVTAAQAHRWARGSLLVCETLYAFCLLKNKWFPKQTLSRHYYYFPFLPLPTVFCAYAQTVKCMFLLCGSPFITKAVSSVYYLFLFAKHYLLSSCSRNYAYSRRKREVFPVCVVYFEVNYFVRITQNADIVDIFLPFSYPSDFDLSSIS